jgi:predicted transcriptional regulator
MQHRGEIIKEAVYKSGFSITELAKRLGKSRRWVYLMFENNSVSLDVVLQIGKIIHHNFTKEIKDLLPLKKNLIESPSDYQNEETSNEYWKNKYLRLLEEYNALLKENKNLPEN